MVNPSLQPADLFERNAVVVNLRVAAIDEEAKTVTLDVIDRPKGDFAPKQVLLRVGEGDALESAFQQVIMPEQVMVAYLGGVGRGRRGGAGEIRFYLSQGVWGVATTTDKEPGTWQWTEVLDPQGTRSLFGTYNGHGERLAEMMRDAARGTVFFPAVPSVRFQEEKQITQLPSPATGLALYDLDHDGDLDVIAVSNDAVRVMIQTEPMRFEDRTEALGLLAARGPSISIANAGERIDLLIGGTLFTGGADKFAPSDRLNLPKQDLKHAFFAEINGDGLPDIVAAYNGGGLRVLLNDKNGFRDATADMGLEKIEGVAGGNGYVLSGDWNDDTRGDLYYAIGTGLLLVQDAEGRFQVVSSPNFDFTTTDKNAGPTGGGTFAPLWRADSTDLIVASSANVNFAINVEGKAVDAGGYANEITESMAGTSGLLAEDLDADGYVDVYAVNSGGMENFLYSNRGYGSFMAPRKYAEGIFPGRAHASGTSTAAVAGDVDGDGANDLVLALKDGSVQMLLNASLARRGKTKHPDTQQQALDRTSILTVEVDGPTGSVGAKVQVADQRGSIVAQRVIAGHDLPGSRGPDIVNLAIRDPGTYKLTVRWTDKVTREWVIDLSQPASRQKVKAERPMPSPAPANPG